MPSRYSWVSLIMKKVQPWRWAPTRPLADISKSLSRRDKTGGYGSAKSRTTGAGSVGASLSVGPAAVLRYTAGPFLPALRREQRKMADPKEILRRLRDENPTLSMAEIFELWVAAVREDESALEAVARTTFDDM